MYDGGFEEMAPDQALTSEGFESAFPCSQNGRPFRTPGLKGNLFVQKRQVAGCDGVFLDFDERICVHPNFLWKAVTLCDCFDKDFANRHAGWD